MATMIKNVFLPERINNSFLFGQSRLGLEITKTSLIATLVYISGKNALIKEFYTEPIIKKDDEDNEQSISIALKNLQQKVGQSFQMHLALPNNLVIFKELTLPFIDREQIQQILPFELESQIPFAIKDILFDFLITNQNIQQKKSTVLVALALQKDIDYYLKLFEKAEYALWTITIDLFAFYGLYTVHPVYNKISGPVVLLDIGFTYTTIAYINNKQLLGIRTINQGLGNLAKNIAEKTNDTPAQVMEFIIRFGFVPTDKPAFNDTVEQELTSFARQIQFTFDAFASQINNYQPPQKIILLSKGASINALDTKLNTLLTLPTEFFETHELLSLKTLKLKNNLNKIPLTHVLSLGAAYPFTCVGLFNLLAHTKTTQALATLKKQVFTAVFMVVVVLGLAVGYSYLQSSSASAKLNLAKNSALKALPQEFDIKTRNLSSAVTDAQQKLEEFAANWEGISGQRISFLQYLHELSSIIDREKIGLDLNELVLEKKRIVMKGRVRDFDALTTLKEKLKESFTLVSDPSKPNFGEIILKVKEESA